VRLLSMPGKYWPVGLGLAASLQKVCAASVLRAVDQVTTALTCGVDCTVCDVRAKSGGRRSMLAGLLRCLLSSRALGEGGMGL
jgi:hypothetical protein